MSFSQELSFCKNQIDSCIYNNLTHINEPLFQDLAVTLKKEVLFMYECMYVGTLVIVVVFIDDINTSIICYIKLIFNKILLSV